MGLYLVYNGPMQTTAAFAGVATGTAIKTMLQIKLGASTNQTAKIKQWHISFNGSAAATPVKCELISTKTVGATITEFVAADIINISDPNAAAVTDDFPLAFTAAGDESGYTATAEGSITATRLFDLAFVAPTNERTIQFPLGNEPTFRNDEYVRIRVHAPADVNCVCYIVFEV
jgi:hypothetical protein